jgi:hypothetical protein
MPNECLPQVQACAMRVARLDPASGASVVGVDNMYVSDSLVSLEFTWEVVAGEEITEKNACGAVKVNYRGRDSIRRGNVKITLVTPDPELSEMLSNGVVLTEGADVGYAAPALGEIDEAPVSVELWAKRIRNGRQDGVRPWARWVYPLIDNLRPDNHTHNSGNLPMAFVGEAYENPGFGDGPANDWIGTSDRVYQWLPDAAIPVAQCGYQAVIADVP